jgi:hypothetical protein
MCQDFTQWFRSVPWLLRGTLALLCLATAASTAIAQTDFELVGTRARGMAGAFVAVADDASATWWNPAGIATVGIFDLSIDTGGAALNLDDNRPIDHDSTWRSHHVGAALALPVVGLSFNQLTLKEIRPSATVAPQPVRQEGAAVPLLRRVRTQHIGLSLAHSLGDALVVGTTLRVVSGSVAAAPVSPDESLERGLEDDGELEGAGATRFTADVGMLAFVGRVRLGVTARNLTSPSFEDPVGGRAELRRQVRIGAAYGGGAPVYQRRLWTVAIDADLTDVRAAGGDRRALAVGAERWWARRRVGIRAGACTQTTGLARPEATAGVSVALHPGMFVEGAISGGADRAADGWGVAGRVTF